MNTASFGVEFINGSWFPRLHIVVRGVILRACANTRSGCIDHDVIIAHIPIKEVVRDIGVVKKIKVCPENGVWWEDPEFPTRFVLHYCGELARLRFVVEARDAIRAIERIGYAINAKLHRESGPAVELSKET